MCHLVFADKNRKLCCKIPALTWSILWWAMSQSSPSTLFVIERNFILDWQKRPARWKPPFYSQLRGDNAETIYCLLMTGSPPVLLRQLLHGDGLVGGWLLLHLVLVVLPAHDLEVDPVLAAHVLLLLEEDGGVSVEESCTGCSKLILSQSPPTKHSLGNWVNGIIKIRSSVQTAQVGGVRHI